jgi:hypothetical protein
MSDAISIPVEFAPSQKNPYGLVGIAYDCKRRLLYLTTLSGSSAATERGKIVVVSVDRMQILAQLEGLDAIGVGVFDDGARHFLLAGSARSSQIFKVALDSEGKFVSAPSAALRLDELNILRARKIRFRGEEIVIDATEFYYNLVAQTEFETVTKVLSISDLGKR